jgi:hypothetical protein
VSELTSRWCTRPVAATIRQPGVRSWGYPPPFETPPDEDRARREIASFNDVAPASGRQLEALIFPVGQLEQEQRSASAYITNA